MVNELEDIVGKLESILKLEIIARDNSSWRVVDPSTSLEDGSMIYGSRDEDKRVILKLLLGDDTGHDKIHVIVTHSRNGWDWENHSKYKLDFKYGCVSLMIFDVLKITETT